MFGGIAKSEAHQCRHGVSLKRGRPFVDHLRIILSASPRPGAARKPAAIEPPERPDRRAANECRGIFQEPFRLVRELGAARIADGDKHVAQEAGSPNALDRTFGEQGAKAGIVEPREIGPLCSMVRYEMQRRASSW